MTQHALNRRGFLAGAAGTAILAASARRAMAAETVVGMIYVGPRDDFGWNQAHAVGAQALKDLPGVTVVEEENVPESVAVSKTMQSMIELDGASLIFATSFGYFDPFMVELAAKYPDVQFRHPTSLWSADKHPMNLGGYFCYIEQAHYVNGVAAGLSTTSNKIGFVGAKPISVVLRNINAFMMGVRSTNPDAKVQLIMTGEWSLPVREAESVNALVDAGCDVIACHVDSAKVVIETAEARGVKTCGHNADQSSLAPRGFITGAELKWGTVYRQYAQMISAGETLPNVSEGGFDKDMVANSPFGAGASEAARKAATEAAARIKAGSPIFLGPIVTNTGEVISQTTMELYDPRLWAMDYLLDGVEGSTI